MQDFSEPLNSSSSFPLKLSPFNPRDFLILVVDDISQNIGLLVRILENEGYGTTFAKNGKQALERIKSVTPDLILLDLMMPGMSGLEVCSILKNDQNYQSIPIIFLTASIEDEHLLEAFEKGAVDYITKPFKIAELLARVKTHLDLKRTQDELKKAYLVMKKLATTDALTSVANRRSILLFGEEQFERFKRYQTSFSLIILDIDHFKSINDNYGHDIGDAVLVDVTQGLNQSLRTVDKLGRLGGEEFLVILPETSLEKSWLAAERLRQSVENMSFQVNSERFNVTISLGVDHCTDKDQEFMEILKRADQALFIAKAFGRNQVSSLQKAND